ncbi:NEP1-interacting protein-like 2 isoform X2 [Prosopis cineraria]|uniref:NEP1-interacting protein-like 2 isoform X2 n=1 Tax=Prosopis cineraria TaxID=364024 RepID=UPI00240F038C|nr:NEP1-interacting protein-like 2 isoform X2 [Prosopis cineraria]
MEAEEIERVGRFCFVSKLILSAIFGALTGCIAMAGAITGAIAGALASRASESGFLRGASLGAIAGAIISVEVFEASRAYWCLEQNGSRSSSSMVGGANTGDGEIPEVHSLISPRGLSGDSLKKLPHHVILKDTKMENLCCTICLQDIEVGEVARSLPRCHHTFHLNCVDRWLVKNDSCPVCRQYV